MSKLFLILSVLLLSAPQLWAVNTVYVSLSGSHGAANGTSCANAESITYANSAGNYSATPSGIQIGPDTTVHICDPSSGGSAAPPALTPAGSGSSGHPIIFQSDTSDGAIFTATYWGATEGAIYCTGQSYITFDGNGTGTIENTAASHSPLSGVTVTEGIEDDCSHSTIENWVIGPGYVHVAGVSTDCVSAGECTDSQGISVANADNVLVTNNTVHDWRICVGFGLPSSVTYNSWEVSFNTAYNCDHDTTMASSQTTGTITSVLIHGNDFSNGSNWDGVFSSMQCDWHHDGIHIFANNGSQISGVQIYNNYIHGLWTVTDANNNNGCFNAHIYFEAYIPNPLVFNNVLELDTGAYNAPDGGYISERGEGSGSGAGNYNNTLIVNNAATSGSGSFYQIVAEPSCNVKNTIVVATGTATFDTENNAVTADYNWYYTVGSYFVYPGNAFISFATWQANPQNEDPNGHNGTNPNLNSVPYTLQAGANAIGHGVNLTSLSITALDCSAPTTFGVGTRSASCVARSSSGAWDPGAYEYSAPASGGSQMSPGFSITGGGQIQ